jgi:hypothetical protein
MVKRVEDDAPRDIHRGVKVARLPVKPGFTATLTDGMAANAAPSHLAPLYTDSILSRGDSASLKTR